MEILQAECDVLVSNDAHLRLALKMPNASVICTGYGGFHEQFVETDEIRDQMIAACLRNIGGELSRRTPEKLSRPSKSVLAPAVSAILVGAIVVWLLLWQTGQLNF